MLFTGSITFRRFRVVGEIPDNYRDLYLQAVSDRRHQEIDPNSDEERAIGWCCAGELLDVEPTLERLFVGDTLVLTLRVDTLKVPPATLQLYFQQAAREFAHEMGRDKLTKRDKEEVKERVVRQLRKRILPTIKGFDCAWSVGEGVLRFWSHNKALTDEFMGLFEDTFGLNLVPLTPYTAMSDLEDGESLCERALAIEPADFSLEVA